MVISKKAQQTMGTCDFVEEGSFSFEKWRSSASLGELSLQLEKLTSWGVGYFESLVYLGEVLR
jgi:hypothetical protein